jgi:hypothetical protein
MVPKQITVIPLLYVQGIFKTRITPQRLIKKVLLLEKQDNTSFSKYNDLKICGDLDLLSTEIFYKKFGLSNFLPMRKAAFIKPTWEYA